MLSSHNPRSQSSELQDKEKKTKVERHRKETIFRSKEKHKVERKRQKKGGRSERQEEDLLIYILPSFSSPEKDKRVFNGRHTLIHTPLFSFPPQADTCCVPASSGRAADLQQTVPPSPELGIVVTAETPPSAALRMQAHLHLTDISVTVIILGPHSPALIPFS